jgi:diguanylate cyclase (GGDEF)-like protein
MSLDHFDSLTGLLNGLALTEQFRNYVFDRNSSVLVLFDLDGLIYVNDQYGHSIGDKLLAQVTDILEAGVKNLGYAFRTGGDEFALILLDKNKTEVFNIIEPMRQKIAVLGFDYPVHRMHFVPTDDRPFRFYTAFTTPSVSVGISFYPQDGDDLKSLTDSANLALSICKKLQGNKIIVFDKIHLQQKV